MNLQIEPHFYLNALNVINVTAQMGDTKLIQQMTENLSLYMRYITGSKKKYVTIQEELEHVNRYLKIMETKLGEVFYYREQINEELLSLQIPPLTIQTLVENSLKYAFDAYNETVIELSVQEENEYIRVMLSDNGCGYPEEYLGRYNHNQEADGNHIGIMNLRNRLKMMYGDRASLKIGNTFPHGAYVEIRINKEICENESIIC